MKGARVKFIQNVTAKGILITELIFKSSLPQIGHDESVSEQLTLDHASFTWGTDSSDGPVVLRDINWRVPEGALVAVVGSVGSGKSSLISAALGRAKIS